MAGTLIQLRSVFLRGLLLGAIVLTAACSNVPRSPYTALVGTYTNGPYAASKGIYAFDYDAATGTLTNQRLAANAQDPSFLVASSDGQFLYAVNELARFENEDSGAVSAFRIDPETRELKLLNTVATHGAHPCHLSLDRTGRWLVVANYTGGSVAVFAVKPDGSLADASQLIRHVGRGSHPRQDGPHAHSIDFSADNRVVYVADLGLDGVFLYDFDAEKGQLSPHDPAEVNSRAGAGPRHLAFARNGFAYLMEELTSTVTAFYVDPSNANLLPKQTIGTLPEGFAGVSTGGEIEADRAGRHLYVSNRPQPAEGQPPSSAQDGSITSFTIDPSAGTLAFAGTVSTGGKTPRFFTLDPEGKHLLVGNQDSASIAIFPVDAASGALAAEPRMVATPAPVSIVFLKN